MLEQDSSPRKPAVVLSAIFASLLVLRLILFCASFGAIEHDSGWYIGLAKNLAHHHIYASNLNSISEGDSSGVHPSIFYRFSVQDTQGRIYFPSAVTVGPGIILPIAASIFCLGDHVWAYRLAPLITCFALFFLAMIWMSRFSGSRFWLGPSLLLIWLWLYPQFWFQLSYEAFAEPAALFYWLLGAWFFSKSRYGWAGLFLGVAIETKLMTLFGSLAFVVLGFGRLKPREWIYLTLGALAPIFAFELYRLFEMVRRFDWEAWRATNTDLWMVLVHNGSGADTPTDIGGTFFRQKLEVWKLVGIQSGAWGFLLLTVAGIARALRLRATPHPGRNHAFFSLVFVYAITHLAWFIFKSPTGWGRHAWPGLFLGMMLITSLIAEALAHPRKQWGRALIALVILACCFHGRHIYAQPIFDHSIVADWNELRIASSVEGFPSGNILELKDQIEVARFIKNEIPLDAQLHYQGTWLVAEMTAWTDRALYPFSIARLKPGRTHYILFGPFQAQGFVYSFVSKEIQDQFFAQYCEARVFLNASYSICRAK